MDAALPPGYRPLHRLGRGGTGEVWAALEEATGARVAIKLLRDTTPEARQRFTREAAALALLRVPGVVQLHTHGLEGETPWLAMELVEGEPFPGRRTAPDEVVQVTLRLLEALGEVHRRGLIHRDVKPSNVLVTRDGTVVLLDLGLTRGRPLGSTLTDPRAIVGTPRYLSPEQIVGRPCDARADLYAVGVMVFEALAGAPPHDAEDWVDLWRLRVASPAPSLGALSPTSPSRVVRAVDCLLARDPEDRPATADAASAMFTRPAAEVGWLGPRDTLDRLLEAALAGRRVEVWGPARSGRSHHLQAVGAALRAAGRDVLMIRPSSRPYGSLIEATGDRGAGGEAVVEWVVGFLRAGVLLVDDWPLVDEWTRDALDQLGDDLAIVSVRPTPRALSVPTVTEEEVRQLLAGPERLFHVLSGGARLLLERTGGTAGALLLELEHWERLGLARHDAGRWQVTRRDLDELLTLLQTHPVSMPLPVRAAAELSPGDRELLDAVRLAWPHTTSDTLTAVLRRPAWQVRLELDRLSRLGVIAVDICRRARVVLDPGASLLGPTARAAMHLRIAAALPEDEPSRLRHVLKGGGGDALAGILNSEIASRWSRGSRSEAVRLVEEAVDLLREPPLHALRTLARMGALADATSLADDVTRVLERAGCIELAEVVRSARRARSGDADGAWEALSGHDLGGDLAIVGWYVRFERARSRGGHEVDRVLEEAATACRDDAEATAQVLTWKALEAYRRQQFADAALWHREASRARTTEVGRLSSLLNSAAAGLEAGALEEAEQVAAEALTLARTGRHWTYEARAEWILRSAANRQGATTPDLELVEASKHLEDAPLRGLIAMTEAMVALRGGLKPTAAQLAREAVAELERAGLQWGALLANAVACAAAGERDDALIDAATRCPLPEVVLDVLVLAGGDASDRPEVREAARRALDQIPPESIEGRRGMFTPSEAAVRLLA